MNLNTLKTIYNKSPFWLKKIASKLPNSLLIGKDYHEYCMFLEGNKNFSNEKLFNKVKETVAFAYNNIPYYKEEYDKVGFDIENFKNIEDLHNLPKINKDIVRDNFDKFKNPSCKEFFYVTTGGSSGEPMKFLQSSNVWSKECAFVYDFFGKYGYTKKKLKATFRGGEFKDNFYVYNPINNELHFSPFHLNANTVVDYVKVLNTYKPEYFHGYPSAIRFFYELMNECGVSLKFKIKAIFLISENVDVCDIEEFNSFFDCEVTAFYGHSERLIFAPLVRYEGETVLYRGDDRYGYFYFNDGEMIATGFDNYAMPLINYCTGDSIEVLTSNKEFGIQGRWTKEFIEGKTNERISLTALNFHSNLFENVVNYQYYQNKKGKLVICVIPKGNFSNEDKELIYNSHFQKIGKLVDIEIKVVEGLILSGRGKAMKLVKDL